MKTQVKIEFFKNGHHDLDWSVPPQWVACVEAKDWKQLDHLASLALDKDGELFELLNQFCPINKLEFILSLRTAPDEAGIWHDDGSRELAFSLSLNLSQFQGEGLSLRKKNQIDTQVSIGYRPLGRLSLFLTGIHGYEHRTEEVKLGERLVLAGWIN